MNIKVYVPHEKKVITKEIEELVKELVACSMPLSFHIEALKCQSIIIRTDIIRKMQQNNCEKKYPTYDVSIESYQDIIRGDDYKNQLGKQTTEDLIKLQEAVEATKDQIITFNRKPINPRYHLACGGATENSENVDGNIVLYLRRVLCNFCGDSPHQLSFKDMSMEEIENRLNIVLPRDQADKNSTIEGIFSEILRDDHGRVVSMKIGEKDYDGHKVRKILELASTRFSFKPTIIRFFTKGKGDGVGLCQYGANGMANDKKTAEEILNYYYTGIQIEKIPTSCIKYPLRGKVIVIDPGHGGKVMEDYIGVSGAMEKDINLNIANSLKTILNELGAKVILTRGEDIYVTISQRTKLINRNKPDAFISVHQNYMKNSTISGTEAYYYRGDKEAEKLGRIIMNHITRTTGLMDRGVRVAEFALLRDTIVTGIHLEVGYLSNSLDEEKLMDQSFIKKVAEAIAEGIVEHFN